MIDQEGIERELTIARTHLYFVAASISRSGPEDRLEKINQLIVDITALIRELEAEPTKAPVALHSLAFQDNQGKTLVVTDEA
jgi:hypothetical protein